MLGYRGNAANEPSPERPSLLAAPDAPYPLSLSLSSFLYRFTSLPPSLQFSSIYLHQRRSVFDVQRTKPEKRPIEISDGVRSHEMVIPAGEMCRAHMSVYPHTHTHTIYSIYLPYQNSLNTNYNRNVNWTHGNT